MEIKVLNLAGEVVAKESFNEEALTPVNKNLLYYAVNAYLANHRQGTAAAKNKAAVSGGGRKPWRQKGTGRARAGSIRSPLWRKGGVVFPPQPRSYRVELPAKVRRAALREALKDKILEERITLLADYQLSEAKTKVVNQFLQKSALSGKILVFVPIDALYFRRAGRNIPGLVFGNYQAPDFYQILNAQHLLIFREVWPNFKERLTGKG